MNSKTLRLRKQGSTLAVIALIFIPIMIGLGALAIDYSHAQSVITSLHKATDAAALAGAYETSAVQDPATQIVRAEASARKLGALNFADGNPVETNSAYNCTVDVQVTPQNWQNNTDGKCRVIATETVKNMFGPIIGRPTETLQVFSTAAATDKVNVLSPYGYFPVAVDLNEPSAVDFPLSQKNIGDSYTFEIQPNPNENAFFIGDSAQEIKGKVDQYLKIGQFSDGHIDPSLNDGPLGIGDQVPGKNGMMQQSDLGKSGTEANTAVEGAILYVPIVDAQGAQYNQNFTVIGFLAILVTDCVHGSGSPGLKVTGTIVDGGRFGWFDPSRQGNTVTDKFAPKMVKLIE